MAGSHEETGRVQCQELAGCLKSICDILIASIYERDENDLGLAEVEVALIKPKRKNKTNPNRKRREPWLSPASYHSYLQSREMLSLCQEVALTGPTAPGPGSSHILSSSLSSQNSVCMWAGPWGLWATHGREERVPFDSDPADWLTCRGHSVTLGLVYPWLSLLFFPLSSSRQLYLYPVSLEETLSRALGASRGYQGKFPADFCVSHLLNL